MNSTTHAAPAATSDQTVGRMPAEWARHERCLMAWPTRPELWPGRFEEAQDEYAATARAITDFEPVLMAAAPGMGGEAERRCGASVEVIELPLDDSWLRDSGPIFVVGPGDQRLGVDFRFNAWGDKFHPYAADDRIAERLLAHLGIERRPSSLVLERGSIAVDGEGTLITTEQCLLNRNRNPTWSREAIEGELRRQLGVETIIWLPFGLAEDWVTDGHVDGVCAFARPGVVLVQTVEDRANPNWERLEANRQQLMQAGDAAGRALEIIELPFLPSVEVNGKSTGVTSINLYLANGAVIVPVAGAPTDRAALERIADAFPDREVVPAPGRILASGGGGIHCITQQLPAAPKTRG